MANQIIWLGVRVLKVRAKRLESHKSSLFLVLGNYHQNPSNVFPRFPQMLESRLAGSGRLCDFLWFPIAFAVPSCATTPYPTHFLPFCPLQPFPTSPSSPFLNNTSPSPTLNTLTRQWPRPTPETIIFRTNNIFASRWYPAEASRSMDRFMTLVRRFTVETNTCYQTGSHIP